MVTTPSVVFSSSKGSHFLALIVPISSFLSCFFPSAFPRFDLIASWLEKALKILLGVPSPFLLRLLLSPLSLAFDLITLYLSLSLRRVCSQYSHNFSGI
ncbi:hypothetical protein B0T26DRAFT_170720 [Lasiosphaeria miniovina]|uniref:Uncharacterized protein n=1 Tax=Lasiosphaeria miniovina TaxID=1954250 RepID=A0AA40B639_9PEZI|nr:uncharacterized protein B0T26DRAFT_170720 [Lasiosphaeria miniovina]KAK0728414.1 hypothetical protein B0T26DRAFT_170720 [Lasiosphaeria miniovina]